MPVLFPCPGTRPAPDLHLSHSSYRPSPMQGLLLNCSLSWCVAQLEVWCIHMIVPGHSIQSVYPRQVSLDCPHIHQSQVQAYQCVNSQLNEEFKGLTLANDASQCASLTNSCAQQLLTHSASPLKQSFPHCSTSSGKYFTISFDGAASPSRFLKYTAIATFSVGVSLYQACGVRRMIWSLISGKHLSALLMTCQFQRSPEKSRSSFISRYFICMSLSCSHCRRVFASWENGYMCDVMLCVTSPMLHSVTNSHSAGWGPVLNMSSGRWSKAWLVSVTTESHFGSCWKWRSL